MVVDKMVVIKTNTNEIIFPIMNHCRILLLVILITSKTIIANIFRSKVLWCLESLRRQI